MKNLNIKLSLLGRCKIIFILLFIFCLGGTAQNISKINLDLGLSDTLNNDAEIRIYHNIGITNYSSLFRMYKNKSNKWISEYYEHYNDVEGITKLKVEKKILIPKKELEFTYLNLKRSYIFNLPSLTNIQWKLRKRGEIEENKEIIKGSINEKYNYYDKVSLIVDGEGFKVIAKEKDVVHKFEYANPDSYLKYYSDVDELIYMCEILDIIRSEFDIWNERK